MRVKIKKESVKKLFFNSMKSRSDKTWAEIRKEFKVPKSTFDNYKSGKLSIPENLFSKLVEKLSNSEKIIVLGNLKKFPDNFGQVKGGKSAYLVNYDKFKEGREKGLDKMKVSRNISKRRLKVEFSSFELTPESCEFIGAFIGDGFFNCYKNKLYQIEFAGDSRKDLEYYRDIIIPSIKSIIPEIKPHIYKVKSKNSVRVVFYSKKLFYFLNEVIGFAPGVKTYTVKIPDEIMNSRDSLIRATIRGIYDTDGCIFFDKRKKYKFPYSRVVIQVTSEPLYNQLKDYLSREFSLYAWFNPKTQIYIIEICGKKQFERWMSLIGFSNKRHLDRIRFSSSAG